MVAIGALFALPLVRSFLRPPPKFPPVRGRIGEFQATRETGQPFSARDLRGKVWVAARFSVDDKRPASRAMLTLERRMRKLGDAFELVSVGRDDVAVLREQALNHRTNPRRWALVHDDGPLAAALHLDGAAGSSDNELVLVDANLQVRGFYDAGASDADMLEQLVYDAALLVNGY
jgi:hypothetical protein